MKRRKLETKEILIPLIIAIIPLAIFISIIQKNLNEILKFILISFSIGISIAIIYLTIILIIKIIKKKNKNKMMKEQWQEEENIRLKEDAKKRRESKNQI